MPKPMTLTFSQVMKQLEQQGNEKVRLRGELEQSLRK